MADPERRAWEKKMDELIDSFPNDQFLDLLDELIDRAQVAKAARLEELGGDPRE